MKMGNGGGMGQAEGNHTDLEHFCSYASFAVTTFYSTPIERIDVIARIVAQAGHLWLKTQTFLKGKIADTGTVGESNTKDMFLFILPNIRHVMVTNASMSENIG